MKREYTKLFSFIIGITFILSGIIFTVVNTYKDSKEKAISKENDIIDEILDVYEVFRYKTEEFSQKRDSINMDIADYTSYYSGMPKRYEDMIDELNEYETLVREVEDSADYLYHNCVKETYSNQDANNKCSAYVMNYERTVNSFIGDIEYFNKKIEEYNEWIQTENEELSEKEQYEELKPFTAKYYKDYIDINQDGTYLGRIED